jgi:signal peptidase I
VPDDDEPRRPALEKQPDASDATPSETTAVTGHDEPATADDDAEDTDTAEGAGHKRRAPLWLETIVLLAVALVMALLIKTFLVQAFYPVWSRTTGSWCRRCRTGSAAHPRAAT